MSRAVPDWGYCVDAQALGAGYLAAGAALAPWRLVAGYVLGYVLGYVFGYELADVLGMAFGYAVR